MKNTNPPVIGAVGAHLLGLLAVVDQLHDPGQRCQDGRPRVRRAHGRQVGLADGERVAQALVQLRDLVLDLREPLEDARVQVPHDEHHDVRVILGRRAGQRLERHLVLVAVAREELEHVASAGGLAEGGWGGVGWG